MSERFTDNDLDDVFRQSLDKMETAPSEGFWVKASENDLFLRNLAHARQLSKWKMAAYTFAALFVSVAAYTVYTQFKTTKSANDSNIALANVIPVTNNSSDKVTTTIQQVPSTNNNIPSPDITQTNSTNSAPVALNAVKNSKETEKKSSVANPTNSKPVLTEKPIVATHKPTSPVATTKSTYVNGANSNMREQEPIIHTSSLNELIAANQMASPIEAPNSTTQTIYPENIAEVNSSVIATTKTNLFSKLSVSLFYQPYINDELFEGDKTDEVPLNNTVNNEEENSPYQVGIRLGYDISRHISVITGCYYYSFQVCISPTTIVAQQNDDGIGYQFQTSLGNVTCPYEGKVRVGDVLVVNGTAKANYISVPLLFKYNFTPNSRLRFYITAGGNANFVTSRKMELYWLDSRWDDGYDVEGIESKQKVYFSYYFAPGISYGLFKGLSLYIEPSLQGSPILSASSSQQNGSSFIGLGGGLTYHF